MSNVVFLKDLNEIDETYIREAEPGTDPESVTEKKPFSKRNSRIIRAGAMIAAVLLLAVGAAAWGNRSGQRIEKGTGQEEVTVSPTDETRRGNTVQTEPSASDKATLKNEADASEILYQDGQVTVRRITEPLSKEKMTSTEFCLAYRTEREMFEVFVWK